jgi:ketosteroid isomerase-like protein
MSLSFAQPLAGAAAADPASSARETSGPDARAPAPSARPLPISSRRVAEPASMMLTLSQVACRRRLMPGELETLARRFFGAYGDGDLATVRALLADDLTSYVTNAGGGVDRVEGADAYVARLPDTSGVDLSVEITQVVEIDAERVMTMVEIRADRDGRKLHNFAAFLARVSAGLIAELWMVEAEPATSDEYWS